MRPHCLESVACPFLSFERFAVQNAVATGPEDRKPVAHGVRRGWTWVMDPQPQRGDRIHSCRNLSPLRGWTPSTLQTTADAVGYHLSVLRT